MAEATTYNIAGIREDLTDALTILEPEDCPKLSMLNKTPRPTNSYQEWQMDSLQAPSFTGRTEGSDVTNFSNKAANRARVGNYIQWQIRPWMVSRITEAVDVAGVTNEVANAKAKSMRELKRDFEAAIGSDNDRQADNGTVPYLMRALGTWISSTGPADVPVAYRTPAASINATATASLSEDNFNAVAQSVYEQVGGRKNMTLFSGPSLKRAISKFQRQQGGTTAISYMVTQGADENQITLNVELYEGDFGVYRVIPDLFNGVLTDANTGGLPGTSWLSNQVRARGYMCDTELLGVSYMIGMESMELPDQGGGRRGFVQAIMTLMCKNPRGLGKFNATS